MTANVKNALIVLVPFLALWVMAYFFFFSVNPSMLSLGAAQAHHRPDHPAAELTQNKSTPAAPKEHPTEAMTTQPENPASTAANIATQAASSILSHTTASP